MAAAEQRQYDLKRKAASLDQLMDFTLKRPALMAGAESDSESNDEPDTNHDESLVDASHLHHQQRHLSTVEDAESGLTIGTTYVHIKQEIESPETDQGGNASSDTGSFTSHVDNQESNSPSPSQSTNDVTTTRSDVTKPTRRAQRRSATMLENVLKKLKEK